MELKLELLDFTDLGEVVTPMAEKCACGGEGNCSCGTTFCGGGCSCGTVGKID